MVKGHPQMKSDSIPLELSLHQAINFNASHNIVHAKPNHMVHGLSSAVNTEN
jgi:hypothetical protein